MKTSQPLLFMTPGPTRVPYRELAAGARPMIDHRTTEFSAELAMMLELLRPVFGTRAQPVLPVHTTGRGAMEASICNLFSPGDAIAVCCNGKFGEMWAIFARSYGLVVHRVADDWERDVDPSELDSGPGDESIDSWDRARVRRHIHRRRQRRRRSDARRSSAERNCGRFESDPDLVTLNESA